MLSEDNGDIEASIANPCGFFDFDTRFLSLWHRVERRQYALLDRSPQAARPGEGANGLAPRPGGRHRQQLSSLCASRLDAHSDVSEAAQHENRARRHKAAHGPGRHQ
ncbi:glycogen debranching N-terminal domain-containing protein [Micromonospora coriariae]|uniref:glycogen debranching N-terminal domain-containing protein n=1 Tax=Micromonospora coriariae TaxID=285665 RepID=UPI001E2C1FB1|nr:glycogen debranching N-terminal domain-containing protein [Micromonospora coriariae]